MSLQSIQPEQYTIVVRGERFVLSRDQIFFDSPNYFTVLFTGTFQEAVNGQREVILHRDPLLFKVIQTYLSGYTILPLPDNWAPGYMSQEAALKNLLEDARFYGLEKLVELLQSAAEGKSLRTKRKAISSDEEDDEWQIFAREERWVHRLTVYGKTSAQFYIENSKSAPLFAAFPIREADLPNREKFGTIFAWVHAGSNRGRTGECSWDAMFRQYLIAKVIKE